jgi:sigma-B regulation protein RsbU (phosphoserine phosphatase)
MHKNRKIYAFLFFILILFSFTSCKNKQKRIYLNDSLLFFEAPPYQELQHIQDNKDFIKLTPDVADDLTHALVNENDYIWVKSTFTLDKSLQYKDLALYIAFLRSADTVYLNGSLLGTYGGFPTEEYSSGFKAHYYPIQKELLNQEGENIIFIKIWPGPLGAISSDIFIGDPKDTYMLSELKSFLNSKINLIFSGAMFFVFVLYFIMHIGLKKFFDNIEYIVFALLNLFTILFLFPFYSIELPWIYNIGIPYLTILKITVCSGAFITIYFANSFIISFLKYPWKKHIAELRIILLAIPLFFTYFIPTYRRLIDFIPFITAFVLLQFCFSIPLIVKALKSPEKKVYAYQLLGGFAPVIFSIVIDVLIRFVFKIKALPYFTLYGWQITIIIFLCYLVVRFNNAYSKNALLKTKLEEFNANLEEIVTERTKELSDANFVLTRGLEAVSNVQNNFIPNPKNQYPGWEITASYSILTDNVSGDIYDYYTKKSELKGIGLFDVSGHGIPAGLMTILAKGIISQHFMNSLENKDSLTDVMNKINESYIKEKVNVENYITGLLFRFSEISKKNTCDVEIVNAGHPHPLYFDAKANDITEIVYKNPEEQYGMIGVEGLNVSFPVTTIKSSPDDIFVLFTDGLIEAHDNTKEQFGIERVKKIVKANKNASAQNILDAINKGFTTFLDGEPVHDDITVIVAKRKKASDFIEEL